MMMVVSRSNLASDLKFSERIVVSMALTVADSGA